MNILYFLCADACVIDAQSNRASAFNLMEEMNAAGFPAVHHSMTILTTLEREKGEPDDVEGNLVLRLNGETILDTTVDFKFRGQPRCRNNATLQGVPISAPGLLTIDLKVGSKKAHWQIRVNAVGKPILAPPPSTDKASSSRTTETVKNSARKKMKKKTLKKATKAGRKMRAR